MHTRLALTLLALVVQTAPVAAEPRFDLSGHKLVLPSPVTFETGSDRLRPDSDAALAHVQAYLAAKAVISTLRIEDHGDNQGDAAKGQALSERRALAVARALVKRGVACERLLPVGFGATKPVADNGTPEGRAQNRRVDFFNAALRGRPIGGMPADGGGKIAGDPCK